MWSFQLLLQMPLDVFPTFAPPQVEILTEAAGFAPEEVESLVTLLIGSDFNDEFGLKNGYAAGARLRWNFFSAGAARFGAAQEDVNRAIAETRFAQTRNQIRFQVEQAYKKLQANARSIQTAFAVLQRAVSNLPAIKLTSISKSVEQKHDW